MDRRPYRETQTQPTTSAARALESILIATVFLATLAHSVWAVTRGWRNPILDMHEFRQTQTAISAYYMLHGGPWLAYETPVLGPPWSIPFEFPLFQWIVVGLVTLFRSPLDQTGRFAGVSFFYCSLIPAYSLLASLGIRRVYRLVFLSLFLASPLYLFWSRTFMIESTALFFGIAYLACVAAYLRRHSKLAIVLGCFVGVVAALVKNTTFLGFGIAAGILVVRDWVKRDRPQLSVDNVKRYLVHVVAFAVIPFAFSMIWTGFADGLKAMNPLGSLITSRELLPGFILGSLTERFSSRLWIDVVYDRMLPDILGNRFLLWLLIGFLLDSVIRKGLRLTPTILSLLTFFAVILVFTNLHIVHNYYQYSNAVFLIAAAGFAIHGQLEDKCSHKAVALAIFVCLIICEVTRFRSSFLPLQQADTSRGPLMTAAEAAKELTSPGDILLILGYDWSPAVPYYSERRALMDPGWAQWEGPSFQGALRNLQSFRLGAMLVCQDARSMGREVRERLAALRFSQTPVYENESCEIYLPQQNASGGSPSRSDDR